MGHVKPFIIVYVGEDGDVQIDGWGVGEAQEAYGYRAAKAKHLGHQVVAIHLNDANDLQELRIIHMRGMGRDDYYTNHKR